ncbi:MAG: PEGA domain-containing protein [Fibrobacter sp.]|uniref:PEGA domain-containing protein n=1 Tax=Fibrobacter sp. TaxID=35828 RepID=UPI0038904E7E|nr:PEGA domain-containing protein [Fibrobacter sp.]
MKKLYIFALMVAFLFTAAVADEDPPPRDKPAVVNIITNPPNSEVYLGGELLGKSPIENMSVKSGRQTLVVIDQGFELVNQRVNIWPGKDKRNDFDFGTKIPKGHIKVTTNPGKCIIFVDGDQADKTDGAPLTIHNLDAGDHVVRAECSNRRSAEELVTVRGEETAEVTIDATKGKKKK